MALGVSIQSSRLPYLSSGPGQAISSAMHGLAGAIGGASDTITKLNAFEKDQSDAHEKFKTEESWHKLQGAWSRSHIDDMQAAAEDGTGLTDKRYDRLSKEASDFLATVPQRLRPEFGEKVQSAVQSFTTSAYVKQTELRNKYQNDGIARTLDQLQSERVEGFTDLPSALAQFETVVDSSALPEAVRNNWKEAGRLAILESDFTAARKTILESPPIAPKGPADIALPGATPGQRGFLYTTGSREGRDYNVRYDGSATGATFNDFAKHPGIPVDVPEDLNHYTPEQLEQLRAGTVSAKQSTAAGKYQITLSTWNEYAPKLGVTDFSPASQDKVALAIAEDRWEKQRSDGDRSFQEILTNGSDEELSTVREKLSKTWIAFKNMADAEFIESFRGEHGVTAGGVGAVDQLDVWNNPAYRDISYDRKLVLSQQADAVVAAQQKRLNDAKTANADHLEYLLRTGQATPDDIEAAIQNNLVPVARYEALQKKADDAREATRGIIEYQQAINAGQKVSNTAEGKKTAQQYYVASKIFQGVQAQTPEAAQALSRAVVNTGVLSQEMEDVLIGMANSNDPRQVLYSMNLMADIHAKAEHTFGAAVSEETFKLTQAWELINRYSVSGDQSAVAARFAQARDPERQALIAAKKKDIDSYLEELSSEDILSNFRDSYASQAWDYFFGPDLVQMPPDGVTRTKLTTDFHKLFRENLLYTDDMDQAAKMAANQMKYHWAPETISGTARLMYHGPSSPAANYEPLNGDYTWQRDDLFSAMGWDDSVEFQIIPDATTEGDIAAGRPASYLVYVRNERGEYLPVPQADGSPFPQRVRFSISPELRAAKENAMRKSNLEARMQRLVGERAALFSGSVENASPEDIARSKQLNEEYLRLEAEVKEITPSADLLHTPPWIIQQRLDDAIERRNRYGQKQSNSYRYWDRRVVELRSKLPKENPGQGASE